MIDTHDTRGTIHFVGIEELCIVCQIKQNMRLHILYDAVSPCLWTVDDRVNKALACQQCLYITPGGPSCWECADSKVQTLKL
jgi:hypothetical protein